MPVYKDQTRVSEAFFAPLKTNLQSAVHLRHCPSLSDERWLSCGIKRVLGTYRSGRDFLQSLGAIGLSHFFETLKSGRRLELVSEVSAALAANATELLPDALAEYKELDKFEVFAGDGHYHEHACHDVRNGSSKRAIAHFFALNLRSHTLGYLSLHDLEGRKKEHDMHMLKRLDVATLRQGTPTGKKVIWVWDKAGIDFRIWWKWKENNGIYFISLAKENMNLIPCGDKNYDRNDPINTGVISDRLVGTSSGVMMREVVFEDIADGQVYRYITSEMTLPPGLIALLYKMRWNIEKVFDQTKTKLAEKKAWASSDNAKAMQAHFLCLAHNALLLYEHTLVAEHGIEYHAENRRREKRHENKLARMRQKGCHHGGIYQIIPAATQRPLKFIRWLRACLQSGASHAQALPQLQTLYASL
jgi:hypothetical protein